MAAGPASLKWEARCFFERLRWEVHRGPSTLPRLKAAIRTGHCNLDGRPSLYNKFTLNLHPLRRRAAFEQSKKEKIKIPMPTPTPSSTALFNLPFLNTIAPALAVLLQLIALAGAVYGFSRFIADLVGWLRRPRLKLFMSDDIWPVAEPNHSEFAINVQFVVYNPGRRIVVLRRLEADLIRPSFSAMYPKKSFTLVWRRFIKGNPSGFEHTEGVFAKPVPPHESDVLGVQLRGHYDQKDSSRAECFDWFPGQYVFHLYGRINNRHARLSPRSGFRFELNDLVSGQLSPTSQFSDPFSRSVQVAP